MPHVVRLSFRLVLAHSEASQDHGSTKTGRHGKPRGVAVNETKHPPFSEKAEKNGSDTLTDYLDVPFTGIATNL